MRAQVSWREILLVPPEPAVSVSALVSPALTISQICVSQFPQVVHRRSARAQENRGMSAVPSATSDGAHAPSGASTARRRDSARSTRRLLYH